MLAVMYCGIDKTRNHIQGDEIVLLLVFSNTAFDSFAARTPYLETGSFCGIYEIIHLRTCVWSNIDVLQSLFDLHFAASNFNKREYETAD
jgi:hypothetical protein